MKKDFDDTECAVLAWGQTFDQSPEKIVTKFFKKPIVQGAMGVVVGLSVWEFVQPWVATAARKTTAMIAGK